VFVCLISQLLDEFSRGVSLRFALWRQNRCFQPIDLCVYLLHFIFEIADMRIPRMLTTHASLLAANRSTKYDVAVLSSTIFTAPSSSGPVRFAAYLVEWHAHRATHIRAMMFNFAHIPDVAQEIRKKEAAQMKKAADDREGEGQRDMLEPRGGLEPPT
jgi:hypothetical protein